jgi:hypothetical protein
MLAMIVLSPQDKLSPNQPTFNQTCDCSKTNHEDLESFANSAYKSSGAIWV